MIREKQYKAVLEKVFLWRYTKNQLLSYFKFSKYLFILKDKKENFLGVNKGYLRDISSLTCIFDEITCLTTPGV